MEKLAETQGLFDGIFGTDLSDWHESLLYGPVTWSGEANGVSIELSHTTCLESGGGPLGKETLEAYWNTDSWVFDPFLNGSEEAAVVADPQPGAIFSSYSQNLRVQVGNPGGTPYNIQIRVEPDWHDPEIVPSGSSGGRSYSTLSYGTGTYQNHATFYYFDTIPLLKQGETYTDSVGSGGGKGNLGNDLLESIGPDFYAVTVQKGAGESFQIPLTPRYTTPDGGTFTLDGEEGPQ